MEAARLCVLVTVLAISAQGNLTPPERSYKILMLLPVSSKSHNNVFQPMAEAMADRGHKVNNVCITHFNICRSKESLSNALHHTSTHRW